MPSGFIRNVFPRRLRHGDDEKTLTSQAAGEASDKATSCALQDPPPPYASGNHAVVDDDKALLLSSPLIQPYTPPVFTQPESKLSASDSIQFCPHAISSFERIQRILRLSNFKQSYQVLDALTPGPDHRNSFTPGFRLCKPDTGSDLSISESSFQGATSSCSLLRFNMRNGMLELKDCKDLNRFSNMSPKETI